MTKQTIEQVEKVLGEPLFADLTDTVRKIRNHLVIVSMIGIFVVAFRITIDPNSDFFGMKFEGLNNWKIYVGLLAITLYMFLHFLWCSQDSFLEWRIRLTGSRTAFITGGLWGEAGKDYPGDPRQSSLYNWWKQEARKLSSFSEMANNINSRLLEWQDKILIALEAKDPNIQIGIAPIQEVGNEVRKLHNSIDNAMRILDEKRIPVSLKRFDQTYHLLLKSQNLRWLILELGLPLIMGFTAMALLVCKLMTC